MPIELKIDSVASESYEAVWPYVLKGMAYRLECLFYRESQRWPEIERTVFGKQAARKQRYAMLEFDSTIDRIILHDLVGYCPFSM